jgi:hypothetical protein
MYWLFHKEILTNQFHFYTPRCVPEYTYENPIYQTNIGHDLRPSID